MYEDLDEPVDRTPCFFLPNDRFFAWADKNLFRDMVFDVGAGKGHVTDALALRGISVLGLDPYGRAGRHVMLRDGTDFDYPSGATTVMLCRPCHGDFVARVIERAAERDVERVLYVGLERNLDRDLQDRRHRFVLRETSVGDDGENIWEWRMRGQKKNEMDVALVRFPYGQGSFWVCDAGSVWENWTGGRMPKGGGAEVLDRRTVPSTREGWQSLDWTVTGYASKPDADYGWLAPDGTFYGCDYQGHASLAELILKRDVSDLEAEKFVRVDGPGALGRESFRVDGELTEAQRAWLLGRGHDLDPYGTGKEDLRLIHDEADQERFERACAEAVDKGLGRIRSSYGVRTGD